MTGGATQALSPTRHRSGKYHDDCTDPCMHAALDSSRGQDLAWLETRDVGERLVSRDMGGGIRSGKTASFFGRSAIHRLLIAKMVFLKGIAAAACATSALAADIIVQNSGGNQTGAFGHSYGYGFLHEVSYRHHHPCQNAMY